MVHFIELTQEVDAINGREKRKIKVAVEQLCFYYDHRLVFNKTAIDVKENFDEITNIINNVVDP